MSSASLAPTQPGNPALSLFVLPLKLFHVWLSLPAAMFLLALTAMLFRPPDLKSFPIDRVAFFSLVLLLAARIGLRRGSLRIYPATWPLLGLMLIGLWGVLTQPYDPQAWSVFAAKWVVPCVFFHIAGLVFCGDRSLRKLEIFLLLVLAYLTAISIFSMLNFQALIVPRFITDEGIGIHADRARGPFLQAVANGLCLNLLGLVALDSFRRRKLHGIVAAILFFAVPLALLATKTRAVWIASVLSVVCLLIFGSTLKLRRIAFAWCIFAIVGSALILFYRADQDSFAERAMDRSPVDFRSEMYSAGWQMFVEKPLLGWGSAHDIQAEVEKRVSNFHPEYYVFHNTFLELAVERGVLALGLHIWLMICLFRLGRAGAISDEMDGAFSNPHFRKLWPLLLGVYLLNASAVVMNYQFANAVLFTIAGILAAQTSGRQHVGQPGFSR
ncbi:MAG TPA: O-antigen ligase family protein [Terriglobales bacterium]|nr:O-antigen ligase family protein [Terriglobales bacterium]